MSTTTPLALRLPKICDGFWSWMLFQTTDEADGWMNVVVSPAPMLNDCQLRKALCEAVMLSWLPLAAAVAEPLCTVRLFGLAKVLRVKARLRSAARNGDKSE